MAWYIPLLIMFARLCDVPLGTIRMIFVIAGKRWTASILGFFEVIIWALAVGGVIKYLPHPLALVGYGAGFAIGTFIGVTIEERIAVGLRIVEVINPDAEADVTSKLRADGRRVTRVDGQGMRGAVEVAKLVVQRREVPGLLDRIRQIAPEAFVSVERAERAIAAGGSPSGAATRPRAGRFALGRLGGVRK